MVTSEDRDGCKLATGNKLSCDRDAQIEEMLVARGHTKIEKVTLDDLKLTAIFSKRRKIGASWHETCAVRASNAGSYYGNVRRPWRVQAHDHLFPKTP